MHSLTLNSLQEEFFLRTHAFNCLPIKILVSNFKTHFYNHDNVLLTKNFNIFFTDS